MVENPKVSVVVPTFNVEDYLEEALDSLKAQTLQEIEFVCVNDGATDSSPEILHRYAERDERFVVLDGPNGGYGKAMNRGLDAARGEYIGILEPDDYVPANMFEDLYVVSTENDLDFVKADFFRFKHDGTGRIDLSYHMLDRGNEYYNILLNPSETPFLTKLEMNTWTGIYKQSFLNQYHIRHNETPGASFQDNGFFWQTSIYAKRAMLINKPMYTNRRDNPNSSVKNKEKVYCINIEYDYIKDILLREENKEIWDRFKYYFSLMRFNNYLGTLRRIDESFHKEYIERISKEMKRLTELDEVDTHIMAPYTAKQLEVLINKPKVFYDNKMWMTKNERRLVKVINEKEREIDRLKKSKTYRIGSVFTALPRKVKKIGR